MPNSVWSEDAFRSLLDEFSTDSFDVRDWKYEEEDFESEAEGYGVSDDDFAAAKRGLPRHLVGSFLRNCGIYAPLPNSASCAGLCIGTLNLIAQAKTGSRKTLAFGIPILEHISDNIEERFPKVVCMAPRTLVLAPIRELEKQAEKEIKGSAPYFNTVSAYGGVPYNMWQNVLSHAVDMVVGTPGIIIDLLNSNILNSGEVQYLVLDEADQMLAVGFEEDVEVM
ncbi:hypothetical protein Nepgr_008527 [Nepenthes gracilis]|uniref:Helicase ATP-binding domain-containing protein n=1 Tax=Nepenthes gracilis TaxID=150966 RepID=A0AAD3XJB5_NEPGR|nr:hypothetical protein Nepgr_008527 [Nepenthes gracilis]